MMKVICVKCLDVGFTSSPGYTRCQCGGRLVVYESLSSLLLQNKGQEALELVKSQVQRASLFCGRQPHANTSTLCMEDVDR